MKQKFAFTLAEVMIVLAVIGVLSAVLIPTAMRSKPDENIFKFKKGHNTLLTVVRELVTSDKYYLDGDLGVRSDGQILHQANEDFHEYFISTFADVLNVNYLLTKTGELSSDGWFRLTDKNCAPAGSYFGVILDNCSNTEVTAERMQTVKDGVDKVCKKNPANEAKQIVTADKIWFWDPFPKISFGATEFLPGTGRRLFLLKDNNGLYAAYKVICMDIDGVPESATADDCVNECPFTYGISTDGKIFTSKRADEWLEK
ncbi:MAG: type II secretion system protein [Candidatus Gastranaerophilales bacterium]|nr:type II secretion system protein [Candidatus Gastranaerophilales bacterium]